MREGQEWLWVLHYLVSSLLFSRWHHGISLNLQFPKVGFDSLTQALKWIQEDGGERQGLWQA